MAAARIGLTIEQFENMTPREFWVYAQIHNQSMEFEQERRQREIYASALLISNFVWAKGSKPAYEKVFVKNQEEEMTDDQMMKEVEKLNAKLGGVDLR